MSWGRIKTYSLSGDKGGLLTPFPHRLQQSPTWQARAVIGGVSDLAARPPVLAGRGVAGHIEVLTVLPSVGWLAGALVGAHLVGAAPTILADGWCDVALIDVLLAVGPVEASGAPADVVGIERDTVAPVGAGVGGTGVSLLAGFAWGWGRKKNEDAKCSSGSRWEQIFALGLGL